MERVILQLQVVLWMLLSLMLKYHTEMMMMEVTRMLVLVSVMQCIHVTQCVYTCGNVSVADVLSTYL